MSRGRRSRQRIGRRRKRHEEDINPMTYLANLSDAMLILAVGIMLSLIIHWKVNISTSEIKGSENDAATDITEAFTDDELEDSTAAPENMERVGDIYYDAETGTYYIAKGSGTSEINVSD